jgi:putative heme degradation protein
MKKQHDVTLNGITVKQEIDLKLYLKLKLSNYNIKQQQSKSSTPDS